MKITAVLAGPDNSFSVLPSWEVEGDVWFPDVERVFAGRDAYVLTCLRNEPDEITYLVTGELPPGEPADPPVIDSVVPWAEPEWYAEALPWIDNHLTRTGRPVQVRVWGLSNVLRVPTTDGDVYFKAHTHSSTLPPAELPLLFANEPRLLTSLTGDVPRPLAVDEKRVWMLLPDLGSPLAAQTDIEVWTEALRSHAQLQRSFVGRTDELFESSCVDRRLSVLESALDRLPLATEWTEDLTPQERDRLPERAAQLRAAISELAAIGVPETLLHGDLHPRNIAVRDGQVLAFDWTDAAVSHPFLDLVTFTEKRSPLSMNERVRDAYLAEWTEYAPMADLRRALDLATQLGALHQCVTSLHLMANVTGPDRDSMQRGATWWLKAVLAV
ncbi:aminoglycoside phosphotransferase family protein [Kribbella sandramycini]|uniref:Aminoglycoside phosphotransferase family protein n=1 Tax=Kribbella sandramycini TaxID=60450 RepID=A0A7Y4P2K9_9ACTN|nr:aminoglycoside phosphotransferase family protein [Kribbella sandramycini]MBB6571499.1 hypothetical protein [Kribbella sandramycini]NOL44148.1 aminoglycoside phosphotransferase family protein [Kribbella sandramycini]